MKYLYTNHRKAFEFPSLWNGILLISIIFPFGFFPCQINIRGIPRKLFSWNEEEKFCSPIFTTGKTQPPNMSTSPLLLAEESSEVFDPSTHGEEGQDNLPDQVSAPVAPSALSEEDAIDFVFLCKIDNARVISQILSALHSNTKKEGQVREFQKLYF